MSDAWRRMPAEWEPHRATWISWPHNRDTWPGDWEPIEPAFCRLVTALARSEPVSINVLDDLHEAHVRELLQGASGSVVFHHIPTNDAWCRDHGATFVVGVGGLEAVDFRYNAWGGKYPPFDLDSRVAARMAEVLDIGLVRTGLTLEGGAIETNGEGVLLTTASCVLNGNRNPGLSPEEAEKELLRLLGAHTVLWVEGEIEGDDTDGHIDNLARFVTPTDIVATVAEGALERAYEKLALQARQLGIRVHPLPLPDPLFHGGSRLPASHANFYITNHSVLLPAYGGGSDAEASRAVKPFFPDRQIIPIDCRELIRGLGAVHCLTQQVPA